MTERAQREVAFLFAALVLAAHAPPVLADCSTMPFSPCLTFMSKTGISWTPASVWGVEVIGGRLRSPVCIGPTNPGIACPIGTECAAGDVCSVRNPTCTGSGAPCPHGDADCPQPSQTCRICAVAGAPCSPAPTGAPDTASVRGNEGDFYPTVNGCRCNDCTGSSVMDASAPPPWGVYYYLARQSGPPGSQTWSTGVAQEVPGTGGNRDLDIDGPPKAPFSCVSPP